jgi:hypothetical protein
VYDDDDDESEINKQGGDVTPYDSFFHFKFLQMIDPFISFITINPYS